MIEERPDLGATVRVGEHAVRVGTCSWTDRTLTEGSDWYPRRTMSAEDRLRYYAARFPLVEIDSTYYRPPAEQQSQLWAERTPEGFRFDVKAYSLLTGHPTRPQSLWPDVRERLSPEAEGKKNIYPNHLDAEALDEAWRRFDAALRPLHDAGKLGGVLFQYPQWFGPRRDNRAEVRALRERLPDYRILVEFRSPRWTAEAADRERTLAFLEEHGLSFVAVDAPVVSGLPSVIATTTPDLAVVRFHGRDDKAWTTTTGRAADRFRYDYSDRELGEIADSVSGLADAVEETHLLMNNCYQDYAVRNAWTLRDLVAERVP